MYLLIKRLLGLLTTFSIMAFSNGIISLVGFITTVKIANTIGREQFGELAYAIVLGGYCITILYFGMEKTLTRDLVQKPSLFNEYLSASIILRLALFLIISPIVGLVMTELVPEQNRLSTAESLIVISFIVSSFHLGPVYDALYKFRIYAAMQLFEKLIYFVSIWIFSIFVINKLTLTSVSIYLLISAITGIVVQYIGLKTFFPLKLGRESFLLAYKILRSNLWVWIAILATLSFGALSKVFLKHMSGNGVLGDYAVAWHIVTLGSLGISQILRIGNPHLSKIFVSDNFQIEKLEFLWKYLLASLSIGLMVGLPAILVPNLLLSLFRPEYESASSSLRILGCYVVFLGVGEVSRQILISIRKEKEVTLSVIVGGLFGLALYWILIPRHGATGASISVLLSHGITLSLCTYFVIKRCGIYQYMARSGR